VGPRRGRAIKPPISATTSRPHLSLDNECCHATMGGMSDVPVECRVCGTAIHAADSTREVGGSRVHASYAPSEPAKKSRKERRPRCHLR
jgi:hypothetical protein